jgi:hypothetical protein
MPWWRCEVSDLLLILSSSFSSVPPLIAGHYRPALDAQALYFQRHKAEEYRTAMWAIVRLGIYLWVMVTVVGYYDYTVPGKLSSTRDVVLIICEVTTMSFITRVRP